MKTQDREKSLSPLDKDHLKQRCLERVRSERSRLMARMRGRRGLEGGQRLSGDGAGAGADSPLALATVREILRQGLSDLSGGNSTTSRRLREQQQQQHKQAVPPQPPINQATDDSNGGVQHGQRLEPSSSVLSAIEEENATYLNACAGGRGSPLQPRPPFAGRTPATSLAPLSTSLREECQGFVGEESDDALMVEDSRGGKSQQQQPEAMEGDGLGWGGDGVDSYCDENHMLSPEEYLEMMQYIEEACKEEDRRAEAEVGFCICSVCYVHTSIYCSCRDLCPKHNTDPRRVY